MESTFLSAIYLLDDIFAELEWERDQEELIRNEHKHTVYCVMWFMGTSKWGCKLDYEETGGEFDKSLGRCRYRNRGFED